MGLVLGLSITTVSGVRVSYKTAHANTDTMANKTNTAKNTYCQSDDSESFVVGINLSPV